MESYDELSNMYSFDSIIEQMQKMVTEFMAAHRNFDKMTMDERVTKFRSWNGNEDYINNNFLVSLLQKCREDTREQIMKIGVTKEDIKKIGYACYNEGGFLAIVCDGDTSNIEGMFYKLTC